MHKSIRILFIFVLLVITGCSGLSGRLPKTAATVEGTLINLQEGYFLLASESSGLLSVGTGFDIYNEKNEKVGVQELKNGQQVAIGFSGMIMDSYPGQLDAIKYIKILTDTDYLVGLYAQILDQVLAQEGVLASDDQYAVLDLSQIQQVSDVQKQALANFALTPWGVYGVVGTKEDYLAHGYSDHGVFLSFNMEKETEDEVKFEVYGLRKGESEFL